MSTNSPMKTHQQMVAEWRQYPEYPGGKGYQTMLSAILQREMEKSGRKAA